MAAAPSFRLKRCFGELRIVVHETRRERKCERERHSDTDTEEPKYGTPDASGNTPGKEEYRLPAASNVHRILPTGMPRWPALVLQRLSGIGNVL